MSPEGASSRRRSLAAMQASVMSLVTGRQAVADGEALDAATLIVGDDRAGAEERVHVYANMYRARIVEALESQFPRLAKRLGADDFGALASAYITDEPSRHPSLRYVGERLSSWLGARGPESRMLAGLAALEWARADVFDLADEPLLTLEALHAWPMERFGELPLRLVTAHRLVTVPRGTAPLWDELGGEVAESVDLSPVPVGTESLCVWREGTVVYHRLVDEAERAALELASSGTHFGVICESLVGSHGEEAAVAQAYTWMSTWLTDGLLVAVPLP